MYVYKLKQVINILIIIINVIKNTIHNKIKMQKLVAIIMYVFTNLGKLADYWIEVINYKDWRMLNLLNLSK